jgi:hypothetical protein
MTSTAASATIASLITAILRRPRSRSCARRLGSRSRRFGLIGTSVSGTQALKPRERRSSVGFDRVFDLIDESFRFEPEDKYPPYDIVRTGEDSLAVRDDLMAYSGNDQRNKSNLTQAKSRLRRSRRLRNNQFVVIKISRGHHFM